MKKNILLLSSFLFILLLSSCNMPQGNNYNSNTSTVKTPINNTKSPNTATINNNVKNTISNTASDTVKTNADKDVDEVLNSLLKD